MKENKYQTLKFLPNHAPGFPGSSVPELDRLTRSAKEPSFNNSILTFHIKVTGIWATGFVEL